jgi:hypothetical protein
LQGLKINLYDCCIANKIINGKQMTMLWHVDDLKASHMQQVVLEKFVEYLRGIYDDKEIGMIKVNYGPRHEFHGMILDYCKHGKIIIDMKDYVKNMVNDFKYDINKIAKTLAADHLFKVNKNCSKLNKKMAEDFHMYIVKSLFLCKHACLDIQTARAFLTMQVMDPDKDDWKSCYD